MTHFTISVKKCAPCANLPQGGYVAHVVEAGENGTYTTGAWFAADKFTAVAKARKWINGAYQVPA